MNWKLLGACSALSLLMFADADAMGAARRLAKANDAGLGHSAASVRAYGVAKTLKKEVLAEGENMSTKDFIKLTREKGVDVTSIDGKALTDTVALQGRLDELSEQRKALDAELSAKAEGIGKIEDELNGLIEGKEFKSRTGRDVVVTINPDEVDLNEKFGFDLLFHGLRVGDDTPYISCADRDFGLENARKLWDNLCALRADSDAKVAKLHSIEVELKDLEKEMAMLALEAKVRAKEAEAERKAPDDEDTGTGDSDAM